VRPAPAGCAHLDRMTARAASTLALALLALACRTTRPPAVAEVLPAPLDEAGPCVALVLGGGSARGFAHVGVISALEEAQVPIELVVGTSVGSLVGGLYASGLGGARLEETARELKRRDFFDFYVWNAFTGLGLAPGSSRRSSGATRATGASRPEGRRGDPGARAARRAIRASTATPGVFEPFRGGDGSSSTAASATTCRSTSRGRAARTCSSPWTERRGTRSSTRERAGRW
jgi:predicted acylesterase/phospholipase RssA